MTRKTVKPHKPLGGEKKSASLTDQWIDKNWYLPPGGDQSWRDREARRIFGDGENPVNDRSDSGAVRANGSYEAGFRHAGSRNILLPVSLVACVIVIVGALVLPQILTPALWGPREPKPRSDTLVRFTVPAQASLAYDEAAKQDTNRLAGQALPRPIGEAVAPADPLRSEIVPRPRPAASARESAEPASRVAKARTRRSLPPIGAHYFASHAAAHEEQVAISLPPIGQAYFESHAPSTADSTDTSRTE
jgi:hypothetical protein